MKESLAHFIDVGEKSLRHRLVQRQNAYCVRFARFNNGIFIALELLKSLTMLELFCKPLSGNWGRFGRPIFVNIFEGLLD